MQSYLRLFVVICSIFTIVSSKSKKHEICQFITQSPQTSGQSNSITKLNINRLTIIQDSCVKYFSLDISKPALKDKYVTIEIDFYALPDTPTLRPKFLQKFDSKPLIYFDTKSHSNIQDDAHSLDSNAFTNRKTYHHIVLSPEDIKQGGISYFALYKTSSAEEYYKGQLEYTINVRTSDAFPCPQDCSGNGVCSQAEKKCNCNQGFFDLDCSVEAIPLFVEIAGTQNIEPKQWEYFYFGMENNLQDIVMRIGKSGGSVKLAFQIGNLKNFFLPNFYHAEGSYTLAQQENSLELSITRPLVSDSNERQLVIGVYNVEDDPVIVSIEIESYDEEEISRNTILAITMGVFLGLLAFLATVGVIKYRFYRRTGNWVQGEENSIKNFLTIEEVEKYFPKTKFNSLKSSFPQTLCSVCLEDFHEDASCRQLYCEHIYHDSCIEAWVTKHDNCPNCKKSMTKEAIEGHLSISDQKQRVKEEGLTTNRHNNFIMIPIKTNVPNLSILTTQQPDNEQRDLLDSLDKSPESTLPTKNEEFDKERSIETIML